MNQPEPQPEASRRAAAAAGPSEAGATTSPSRPASAPITLATPLARIRGVRPAHADALERLGVRTLADLVLYTPMRYEHHHAEDTIDHIQPDQIVTVRGDVTATRIAGPYGKQRFEAVLLDHTGRLDLVWFNMTFLQNQVYPGVRLRVHGKAKQRGPGFQLANPKHQVLKEGLDEPEVADERLRPVYSASEAIGSDGIERVVEAALPHALPLIEDHLPEEFRRQRSLPPLAESYRMAHRPATELEWKEAQRRLAFDELLLLQLAVFLRRAQSRAQGLAPKLKWSPVVDQHIRARFPFALTESQDAVISQIVADLRSDTPANRLIQGDVGSGKTVVALYALLMASASGLQGAIMAPTEILAEQHFVSISRMLQGSSVRTALLTGSITGVERESTLAEIAAGDIDIVVGTHALISEHVRFKSLAVIVIDEQHRFGVSQRADLRAKADEAGVAAPHVLVMTATPIPRTLALTLFGDLDISTILHLPPGRSPIVTKVVTPAQGDEVYHWVRTRVEAGEQAYVVVPAIDSGASTAGDGGDAGINDLRTVQDRLEKGPLQGKRVAALHGRLSGKTRDAVMHRFRSGLIDVLVSTTVIEVGVDVPNATVMIIEHAERFGLAQLHQLRGRVGRGNKRSACILIGEPTTPDALARLQVMAASTDGFVLAEKDFEIRGPGEIFGFRQAGAPPFRVADLMRDRELLSLARRDAAAWIQRSPGLDQPGEALLRRRLLKTHGTWLGLGDMG